MAQLRTDTSQWIEKWGRRLKSAQQDISTGVMAVSEPPGVAAARQVDKMRSGILESLDNGTWQRAVEGVSLQDWQQAMIQKDWQQAMIQKGIPRLSIGVDQAADKIRGNIDALLADVASSKDEVDRMPNGSFADSIQRMTRFSELMHQKKLSR